ncbi:MAG: hypothetical protein WBD31_11515 [Rubripirellula sp.]
MTNLNFIQVSSLPRLSWGVCIARGSDTATAYCGRWVETKDHALVEGVWDGAFERFDFARAHMLSGSGAIAVDQGWLFVTSTHLIERLYSVEVANKIFVSNSLVFAMTLAGDRPDPTHTRYSSDIREHLQKGVTDELKILRTSNDANATRLHDGVNFVVTKDLKIQIQPRDWPRPGSTFQQYRDQLVDTLDAVMANAQDQGRVRRFDALSTLSRGYDSLAVTVIAKEVGCEEAMTFRDSRSDDPQTDSGEAIGKMLGVNTHVFDRYDYLKMPGLVEAEFMACPFGIDVVMAPAEQLLEGKLLLTGRFGDVAWSSDGTIVLSRFEQPGNWANYGSSMLEFRLRIGFFRLPLPYQFAYHGPDLHRLTMSPELAPWRIGGNYDRPIPRRIVEEAGIPRSWFGQSKMATGYVWFSDRSSLSDDSLTDYLEATNQPFPVNPGDAINFDFMMSWGFEKIRDRYSIGPASSRHNSQDG